ncbi:hypothetical protein DSO57_1009919 [Entomophthora muscae]|uniref:Uncharacterized protein n=1 Tax=Entomophthora muscae TaxID=34485 RepID=A0ACC2SVI0_9FUNG|nr:hypothetical protein DSO57_1009919 [Entomophthora muscae]
MFKLIQLLFLVGFFAMGLGGQMVTVNPYHSTQDYDTSYKEYPAHQDLKHYDYYAVKLIDVAGIPEVEKYLGVKYVQRIAQLEEWFLFHTPKSEPGPSRVLEKFHQIPLQNSPLSQRLQHLVLDVEYQKPRVFGHGEL